MLHKENANTLDPTVVTTTPHQFQQLQWIHNRTVIFGIAQEVRKDKIANPYKIRALGSIKRANKDLNDAYLRGWLLDSISFISAGEGEDRSGEEVIAVFHPDYTKEVQDEPLSRLA